MCNGHFPGNEESSGTESTNPLRIESSVLFRGGNEIVIVHNGATYRLRLTSNDKLILTK